MFMQLMKCVIHSFGTLMANGDSIDQKLLFHLVFFLKEYQFYCGLA